MLKYKIIAIILGIIFMSSHQIAFADIIIPKQQSSIVLKDFKNDFNDILDSVNKTSTSYKLIKKPTNNDKQSYLTKIKGYKEGYNNLLQKTDYWYKNIQEKNDNNSNEADLSGFKTLKIKLLKEINKLDSIINAQKTK